MFISPAKKIIPINMSSYAMRIRHADNLPRAGGGWGMWREACFIPVLFCSAELQDKYRRRPFNDNLFWSRRVCWRRRRVWTNEMTAVPPACYDPFNRRNTYISSDTFSPMKYQNFFTKIARPNEQTMVNVLVKIRVITIVIRQCIHHYVMLYYF